VWLNRFETDNEKRIDNGPIAQLGRAIDLHSIGQEFDSPWVHKMHERIRVAAKQPFSVLNYFFCGLPGRVRVLKPSCQLLHTSRFHIDPSRAVNIRRTRFDIICAI
jgi:hypothetical protein